MTNPWNGPRYRSWASDTVIFAVVFIVVLGVTALTDYLNGPLDPPAYLVGLCGAAGSALFGAASSDKSKREKEVSATATRAESKADDALGRSDASAAAALAHVIDVQERQLITERAALQSMRDAVEVKEANGIPVVPETLTAIAQLERQTELLAEDIRQRRAQMTIDVDSARDQSANTSATAIRAEAKADDALSRADSAFKRESEWSQHRDHVNPADDSSPEGREPC